MLICLCVLQDIYQRLTFKTVAFWEIVSKLYNVKYVVKVDDDSYVRLDRLSIALSQWTQMGAGVTLPKSPLMLSNEINAADFFWPVRSLWLTFVTWMHRVHWVLQSAG